MDLLPTSNSDEFLNRKQGVSFRLPTASSESDLSTISGGQGDFDDGQQITFNTKDEIIDLGLTEASDLSWRRRGSLSSISDISFAIQIDTILIGLSMVYAFVMSIVGLVIPISEALTETWLNTIYGAVFITYQLTIGILFLLYLQFYNCIYRTSPKPINPEDEDVTENGGADTFQSKGASNSRRPSIRSTIWVNMASFGDIFTHPETSLFLRIGTLVFSLGNLLYYGFEIAGYLHMSDDCRSQYRFGWTFILRFIFILLQTYFLFKSTGISTKKHVHGIWFGMFHLVSTNICLWFRTVVYEIFEDVGFFQNSDTYSTDTYGITDPTFTENGSNYSIDCDDELLPTLSLYLYPFILEYSLIAVGTITALTHALIDAKNEQGHRIQDVRNNFRVISLKGRRANANDDAEQPPAEGEPNILGKSHRGFFVAGLIVAGVVASVILFFVMPTLQDDDSLPSIIFYSTDMCLHMFLFGGCILGFCQMRPLGFVPKPTSTDDVLIIFAMCGSVMYDVTAIIASSDALNRGSPDNRIDVMRLCSSLVAFVQVIAQAMFLLCSLRRYPSDIEHVEQMPGRGAITSLIIVNAAVWVFRTILAKGSDMDSQETFYGKVPWLILMDVNLPLSLFFRFHSAICFADVWHHAYAALESDGGQMSRSSSMSNVLDSRSSASGNKTQNDSRAIFSVS